MSLSLMEAVQAQRSAAVPGSQELNEYSEKLNEAVQAQRRAVPGSQELYGIHLIMVNHVEGKRLETRRVGV